MTTFEPLTSFGPVPADWTWGTATAAHQIEGANVGSDWWAFEHTPGTGTTDSSGDACDSWHRWREDLALVKDMGLDAYRFSIEWSRIEPAEGEFSIAALDHYRDILVTAHEMGLKTSVTFHHFTTPTWMTDQGGWTNPLIIERFARYCDVAVQHLGDHIDIAATLNEPNVVALLGYMLGIFPPGKKGDLTDLRLVTENLVAAHRAGKAAIKSGPGDFPVGLTLAMSDIVVHPDGDPNSEGVRPTEAPVDDPTSPFPWLMAGIYLDAAKEDDYIGVQTYFTQHFNAEYDELPKPADWRVTQMDWTFTPEALGYTVRQAYAAAGVPVIVTENGVATEDDAERIEYYSRSLTALRAAMDDGVDVRGFYAWSLLDNFEWAEGFRPKFGLVEVDPVTFVRTPKPSAAWYKKIAESSRSV